MCSTQCTLLVPFWGFYQSLEGFPLSFYFPSILPSVLSLRPVRIEIIRITCVIVKLHYSIIIDKEANGLVNSMNGRIRPKCITCCIYKQYSLILRTQLEKLTKKSKDQKHTQKSKNKDNNISNVYCQWKLSRLHKLFQIKVLPSSCLFNEDHDFIGVIFWNIFRSFRR